MSIFKNLLIIIINFTNYCLTLINSPTIYNRIWCILIELILELIRIKRTRHFRVFVFIRIKCKASLVQRKFARQTNLQLITEMFLPQTHTV